MSINPASLRDLAEKFERDSNYKPTLEAEKEVMRTLEKLNVVCKDLPGSSSYKQCRRNEIRGLINCHGALALFITINPTDIHHPLVQLFAGECIALEDPDIADRLSLIQKKILVAKNPAAAALFFDSMMRDFIEVILGYGNSDSPGLFGKCKAYYGMVEAQGKGTLHCHILVWLIGHLSPQALRDKMNNDPSFKERMFRLNLS